MSASSSSSASSTSLFLEREEPARFYSISKDGTKPKPLLQEIFLYVRGLFGATPENPDDGAEHGRIVRVSSHQIAINVVKMAVIDSLSNSVTIVGFHNKTGALVEEGLLQSSTLANLQTTSASSIGHKKPIFCVNWLRYTETILLGTKGGVLRYNFRNSDRSSRVFFAHPGGKEVHEIISSPVGRHFCFASKGDITLTLYDHLIPDSYNTFPCMRGSTYLPGSLSWSPSGAMVVLATEANEIIVLDTLKWKHKSCGQLVSMKIGPFCWLNETTCMFASNLLLREVSSHPTVSTIHFDINFNGVEMTSFTPSSLTVDMNDVFGMMGNECDGLTDSVYAIDLMVSDSYGKFLAMSFCEKQNEDNKLPYIVVFLYQTIPFVALTPFTYLSSSAPRRPIRYRNDDEPSTVHSPPMPQSLEFLCTKVNQPTKIVVCYCHSGRLHASEVGHDGDDGSDTVEVVVSEVNPRPAYRK